MNAIKERINFLLKEVNSSDGIIVSIGVASLVCGILVDIFIIRLVCLLVVASSAVLLYALVRVKRLDGHNGAVSVSRHSHSQAENEHMKKLFFDDFQSHSAERLKAEEVYDSASVHEHRALSTHTASIPSSGKPAQPKYYVPPKEIVPPVVREFQISDFFDIDSEIYRGDPEPRTEFNFLLHKVLMVVKDVLFANSVVFFWANREKHQMVMEARVSDSPNFIPTRRYAMGHDLVTGVAENGKPELVSEVNPMSERELLPYYTTPVGIHSFIGVPVYFSRLNHEQIPTYPVAVIAIDSKVEDAFGQETLALLGQFTKLVSALIKSYTDKYDLLLDSELLRSIRRLQERVRNDFSLNTILHSLSEETSKLVSWDHISVVLYEEKKHAW
ncbi:MAG: GAF domain-containing protein, partial [Ignavibacteriae bacterium]|nr:GAF domain-containing protein [Ignavibacteriota bacterium]